MCENRHHVGCGGREFAASACGCCFVWHRNILNAQDGPRNQRAVRIYDAARRLNLTPLRRAKHALCLRANAPAAALLDVRERLC